MTTVLLDVRERALIELFNNKADGHCIQALDCGDIQCTYADGTGWIAERKTACDLAKSMQDGRWPFECSEKLGVQHSSVELSI